MTGSFQTYSEVLPIHNMVASFIKEKQKPRRIYVPSSNDGELLSSDNMQQHPGSCGAYFRVLNLWAEDPANYQRDDGIPNELFIYYLLKQVLRSYQKQIIPTPPWLDFIPKGSKFPSADFLLGSESGDFFIPERIFAVSLDKRSESGKINHDPLKMELLRVTSTSIFGMNKLGVTGMICQFGVNQDPGKYIRGLATKYNQQISNAFEL